MKIFKLLFVFVFLTNISCKSQIAISRIEIVKPTLEQEATSIWRIINDITFFEEQGYTINLPKDSIIDMLLVKSKKGTFGNDDFSIIYALIETKLFDQKNYKQAIRNVKNEMGLLQTLINDIHTNKSKWNWNFKMFETYKVVFTLYGTGGSYNSEGGIITLLTNKEGEFMNYENPANTIIHEITHIGIENSIIRAYQVPHALKERIVDTFVYLNFHHYLPQYSIQDMGDNRIDPYLKSKETLKDLHTYTELIMTKN